MRFFFLDEGLPSPRGSWRPPAELARHLRALRLRPDEEILLLNPEGGAVRALPTRGGALELLGEAEAPRCARRPVRLWTAWPKGRRAEELVVRACEAGVDRIQIVTFRRSVAGREPLSAHQRARLSRLAREACQQLRNPLPPRLDPAPRAVETLDADGERLRLAPGAPPLLRLLSERTPTPEDGPAIDLLVGPEGGLEDKEAARLDADGWRPAGLGDTVLRIEAAGPWAAAAVRLADAR